MNFRLHRAANHTVRHTCVDLKDRSSGILSRWARMGFEPGPAVGGCGLGLEGRGLWGRAGKSGGNVYGGGSARGWGGGGNIGKGMGMGMEWDGVVEVVRIRERKRGLIRWGSWAIYI